MLCCPCWSALHDARGERPRKLVSRPTDESWEGPAQRDKNSSGGCFFSHAYFQTFCVEKRGEEGEEKRGKALWKG